MCVGGGSWLERGLELYGRLEYRMVGRRDSITMKIMSIVSLPFLNPLWLSGRSNDCSRC